jgi:hypothetical protein
MGGQVVKEGAQDGFGKLRVSEPWCAPVEERTQGCVNKDWAVLKVQGSS